MSDQKRERPVRIGETELNAARRDPRHRELAAVARCYWGYVRAERAQSSPYPWTERPLRAILRPDPWGKTWRGRLYFGTLDLRRAVANLCLRVALAFYEWIWP